MKKMNQNRIKKISKAIEQMNRIDQLFSSPKRDLLSVYFCAGHPALDSTVPTLESLQAHGADLVEIGIPFSDPMADGPVIQSASTKALRNGMTLRLLFRQLEGVRERGITLPLLLMGYLNPILQYGFENFCRDCRKCGIDGMIIPDLPFREYEESFRSTAEAHDLRAVMLITPETSEERVRQIDRSASGFLYMVSSAATTGAQKEFGEASLDYFRRIEAMKLRNPRLIGFGISNKATFSAACAYARGGIVGSRFVSLLDEMGNPDRAVERLLEDLKR